MLHSKEMPDGSDNEGDAKVDKSHDIVLVHGRTEDGEGLRAIRSRPERLEAAEIRPIKDGRPINGAELIRLHQREESPLLYDVDVQCPSEELSAGARGGPPRVSSRRYRNNWDAVFGRRSGNKKPLPN